MHDAATCLWIFARGLTVPPIGASASRKSTVLTASSSANRASATPGKPSAACSRGSIRDTFLKDIDGSSARSIASGTLAALAKRASSSSLAPGERPLLRRAAQACLRVVAVSAEGSGMAAMAAALQELLAADISSSQEAQSVPAAVLQAAASVAASAAAAQACAAASLAHLTAFTAAEERAIDGHDDQQQKAAADGVSSAFRLTTRALTLLRSAVPAGLACPTDCSSSVSLWITHALQLGGVVEALHKTLAFWEARPLVAVGLWSPGDYLGWCRCASPASAEGQAAGPHSGAPDDQGALMAALATPAPPTTVRERYAWPSAAVSAHRGSRPPSAAATPSNAAAATPGGRRKLAPKTPAALKRASVRTGGGAVLISRGVTQPTATAAAPHAGAKAASGENWWSLLEKGFFLSLEQHMAARNTVGMSISGAALSPGTPGWSPALCVLVQAPLQPGGDAGMLDEGLPASKVGASLHAAIACEGDRSKRQLLVNESECGIGAALSRLIRMRLCAGEQVTCLLAGDVAVAAGETEGSKADETVHHMKKGLQYLLGAAAAAATVGGASGYDCACTIATAAHNVSSSLYNSDLFQQAAVPMAVAAYALRLSVMSALAAEGPLTVEGRGGAVPPVAAAAMKRHAVSTQYAQLASCLHKALLDSGEIPTSGHSAQEGVLRLAAGAANAAAAATLWRAIELVIAPNAGHKSAFGSTAAKLVRITSDALLYQERQPVTVAPASSGRLADVLVKLAAALPGALDDATLGRLIMCTSLSALAPTLLSPVSSASDSESSLVSQIPRSITHLQALVSSLSAGTDQHAVLHDLKQALSTAALQQVQRSSKALGMWQAPHAVLQQLHTALKDGAGSRDAVTSLVHQSCSAAVQDASAAHCVEFFRLCCSLDQPHTAAQAAQVMWHTSTRLLDQSFPRGGGLVASLLKATASRREVLSGDHSNAAALQQATAGSCTALDEVEPASAPISALTSLQSLLCAPASLLPALGAATAKGSTHPELDLDKLPASATLLLPRLHAAASLMSVSHWDPTALRNSATLQGACTAALLGLAGHPAAAFGTGMHILSITCADAGPSLAVMRSATASSHGDKSASQRSEERLAGAVAAFKRCLARSLQAEGDDSDEGASALLHCISCVHVCCQTALTGAARLHYLTSTVMELLEETECCVGSVQHSWQLSAAMIPVGMLCYMCLSRPSALVPGASVKLVAARAEAMLAAVHDAAHRAVPMSSAGASPVRRIQFDLGAEAASPQQPPPVAIPVEGGAGMAVAAGDDHTARKLFDLADVASNEHDTAEEAAPGGQLTPPREHFGRRDMHSPQASSAGSSSESPSALRAASFSANEQDIGTPLEAETGAGAGKRLRFADTGACKTGKGGVRFAGVDSPLPQLHAEADGLQQSLAAACLPMVEALADTLQCVIERMESCAPSCLTCEVEAVKVAMVWGGVHAAKGRAVDILGAPSDTSTPTCVLFHPLMPSVFLFRSLLAAARSAAGSDNLPLAQQYAQRGMLLSRCLPGMAATADAVHTLLHLHAARGFPSLPSTNVAASAVGGTSWVHLAGTAEAHFHTGHAVPAWDVARPVIKSILCNVRDERSCAAALRRLLPVALASQLCMLSSGAAGCLPKRALAAAATALLPLGAQGVELAALCKALDCTAACDVVGVAAHMRCLSVQPAGGERGMISPALQPCSIAAQVLLTLTNYAGIPQAWASCPSESDPAAAVALRRIQNAAAEPLAEVAYARTDGSGSACLFVPALSAAVRLELACALDCGQAVAAMHVARVLAVLVGGASPAAADEIRALLALAAGRTVDAFVHKSRAKRAVPAGSDWLQQVEGWTNKVASPFQINREDDEVGLRFMWAHSGVQAPLLQLVATADGSAVMAAMVLPGGAMPAPQFLQLAPTDKTSDSAELGGHAAGLLSRVYGAIMPHTAAASASVPAALLQVALILQRSTQSVLQAGITSAAAAEAAKWSASKRNAWWKQRACIDAQLLDSMQSFVEQLCAGLMQGQMLQAWQASSSSSANMSAGAAADAGGGCSPPPAPSEAELFALKVVDLKAELRELGLSVSGRKAELVQRLLESQAAEAAARCAAQPLPGGGRASAGSPPPPPGPAAGLMLCPVLQHLPLEMVLGVEQGVMLSRVPAASLCDPPPCAAEASVLSGAFCLNPGGDLPQTAEILQAQIDGLAAVDAAASWTGTATPLAQHPSGTHQGLLSAGDVFLYAGHGAGETYTPHQTIASTLVDPCKAALLFGCSSGVLRVQGVGGGHGAAVGLLVAGVTSVAGNLWDVTGGDEDRLAVHVLQQWTKLAKEGGRQPLAGSIRAAAGACKLPSLTGGAMVLYGHHTDMLGK